MKYAIFDGDGFPTAFYSTELHGENIPADTIPITDEQWLELINNAGFRKWVDGEVVHYTPPEPGPYVPPEVEGWQAEVAMRITKVDLEDENSQTVWDRVQDIIASMPDGLEKITVQTALARGKIRRDSPMLAQLAPLVPLSESQVDDLLILADSITA